MMLSIMVKFPLLFISGIFVPLSQLPAWGRGIAYISPLTYFTDITRHCIEGQSYLPFSLNFLALVGFTVLFIALAILLHRKTMPQRI
jgi:ABC-2 type transport system permease protein